MNPRRTIYNLTDKQITVMRMVANGLESKAIAVEIGAIDRDHIDSVITNMLRLTNHQNRAHLVATLLREGIIE